MKAWLRHNSSLFRHFSPPAVVLAVCGSCGERTYHATDWTSPARLSAEIDGPVKHLIGAAFTRAGRLDKFCNGDETP